MSCICGRRHLVVFMTFIGMLISIGSREVFTMVVTHLLGIDVTEGGLIKNLVCLNTSATNFHQDWPSKYIFLFQTYYFVGTIFTQIPGGILAARFLPRRVVGVAIFLTSLLTIALRFALQYQSWLVFLIRVVQGIVEGAIVPSFNGVISLWAPKSEKSVLITISYSGAYLSAAVAAVTSGMMICRISWGSALFLYGGIGVVWSLVWLCCIHDGPSCCPGMSDREKELFQSEGRLARPGQNFSEIPWKKILTSLPLSAILVASFCRNWIFALLLTQIPSYFKDVYRMPAAEVGIWSAAPHVMMTVVVICGGFTVDALIKRNIVSTTVARKTAETIGFGVESGCLLALGLLTNLTDRSAIAILCVGVGVSGIAISGYQVNPLDLAPRYVSVLTGIARLGTIGSVISTVIAVKVTGEPNQSKDWRTIFLVAGALHLAGVIYYLIFASGRRQTWAGDDLTQSVGTDHMHDVAGEEDYDSDDESSPLLTKSMRVERIAVYSEEFDEPSWFMNTI
ncbi:vesicular glutamate transporter 3-like isoform X2 [Ruditapes philippinarum]|uniref:vesicular glutamate transporter 3-like isoform X2 n=1 Tax=Ruditapes philippinarum TaxID=129788 RepID=UPI00295B2187|nr:vesicular glutamate transporter 3-like isoform X2 [Ruditapes philippinarum]